MMKHARRRTSETNRKVHKVLLHSEYRCCRCCSLACFCNRTFYRRGRAKPRYKDHR